MHFIYHQASCGSIRIAKARTNNCPTLERPETPPRPTILIPFPRDADFVERGATLDEIHKRLAFPGSWAALVGLGGVG